MTKIIKKTDGNVKCNNPEWHKPCKDCVTPLKITGEHISKDGKNKCIHYSDGVVVIEPIDNLCNCGNNAGFHIPQDNCKK